MSSNSLLYKNKCPINQFINIVIPTVGEVVDNEDLYFGLVSILTAMPIDMMVVLDDAGIDFTTIDEYQLFLMMFENIKNTDTSLIFGDLDLSNFQLMENLDNKTIVLRDCDTGVVIDRNIYELIANTLRKIHHLTKNTKRPANKEARAFLIDRARKKMRRRNKKEESALEGLIVAMVNTEQYKYDFERTRELSIYQFNESVRQIVHKVDYENKMLGVYTGNINPSDFNQDDFNWLSHK